MRRGPLLCCTMESPGNLFKNGWYLPPAPRHAHEIGSGCPQMMRSQVWQPLETPLGSEWASAWPGGLLKRRARPTCWFLTLYIGAKATEPRRLPGAHLLPEPPVLITAVTLITSVVTGCFSGPPWPPRPAPKLSAVTFGNRCQHRLDQ